MQHVLLPHDVDLSRRHSDVQHVVLTGSNINDAVHLRLAGVTTLQLASPRGPTQAFLFDPHRLALPCWALALNAQSPAVLISFDRHFDLVPPARIDRIPNAADGVRAIDEYARWELDVRNYDHILAAMEAGVVGDAILIARARPKGSFEGNCYRDRTGTDHRILSAPTLSSLLDPPSPQLTQALERASVILVDIDLDCFTTLSDADPRNVVPWPRELISEHLMPPDSEWFWSSVLPKCLALTVAREPLHCGGVLSAGHLFEDFASVLFQQLLRTDLP